MVRIPRKRSDYILPAITFFVGVAVGGLIGFGLSEIGRKVLEFESQQGMQHYFERRDR
jgi:hypothetical protein